MFGFGNGAALKRAHDDIEDLSGKLYASERDVERVRAEKSLAGKLANEALRERDEARNTLSEIADMETAGANATVKRMAAKARSIAAKREAV